jgi:hypothetical protein
MVTKDQLERLYEGKGKALFTYLENKNRGGTNNAKGNSFENQFAVFTIADHFNNGGEAAQIHFSAQTLNFIDDLVVKNEVDQTVEHYQIKDVQSLSWTSNPHPIDEDFRMQHALCTDRGETPQLELVVSNDQLKNELEEAMTDDLKAIVSVHYFPNADSISKLLKVNVEVKNALTNMCALTNPSTDKLDALGTIVLGAWSGSDQKQVSLESILDACYGHNPHYIKGFDNRISKGLQTILDRIENFSYAIENGYIRWNYDDTDYGVISYRIGNPEYFNWESEVIHADANNFEELESYLV